MTTVAVLGLGAMGAGMAHNLLQAGLLQAAWNRSEERAEAFNTAFQFATAVSAEAAVSQADVVLTCVSRDEDLLELLNTVQSALKNGALLIDCSTVAVETAETASELLAAVGVAFLAAPVSGGKEGAELGRLAIMAGGSRDDFERALPVFEAIGATWQLMGPIGAGQATKAVNQIMAAGINQAVTEAIAFAQKQNLPIHKVVEVVGSGAAGNWLVNHRGESMTVGTFTPGFRVALHHKDLAICQKMAASCGAPTAVIEQTLGDYEQLMAAGFADEDISALYRLKQ